VFWVAARLYLCVRSGNALNQKYVDMPMSSFHFGPLCVPLAVCESVAPESGTRVSSGSFKVTTFAAKREAQLS